MSRIKKTGIEGSIPDEYLINILLGNRPLFVMLMAEAEEQGLIVPEDCHLYLMAATEEILRFDAEIGGNEGIEWAEERRRMHNDWIKLMVENMIDESNQV